MHVVRLHLLTTAYDEQVIEKRFHALSHVHNVMVKHARRQILKLSHDRNYQSARMEYHILKQKSSVTGDEKSRRIQLSKEMAAIQKEYGLSEYAFQSYLKVCGKQFRKCLSSMQIQKEATRVWKGAEKVIYSDGKELHFKRLDSFRTVGGKNNINGVIFSPETMSVSWLGLHIRCPLPRSKSSQKYIAEALNADISYCDIERQMFSGGWRYYVLICLKGSAPNTGLVPGTGTMGIDPGISSIAGCSDTMTVLEELAPRCGTYNQEIKHLLRHMDSSRRASNPDKYREDGTVRTGIRTKWKYSQNYCRARRKLKTLYRKKSAYTLQAHRVLCNRLLKDSVHFIVEKMNYRSLQKHSGRLERRDAPETVKAKDGTAKTIRKYKKRKQFGRSLNNRSPSLFLSLLKEKAEMYHGTYTEIHTETFKASQYDHTQDTCVKIPLSQRFKCISGHTVQRDLYSAFLIRNADSTLAHPDKQKCHDKFPNFLTLHDHTIETMKANHVSMQQCFGF